MLENKEILLNTTNKIKITLEDLQLEIEHDKNTKETKVERKRDGNAKEVSYFDKNNKIKRAEILLNSGKKFVDLYKDEIIIKREQYDENGNYIRSIIPKYDKKEKTINDAIGIKSINITEKNNSITFDLFDREKRYSIVYANLEKKTIGYSIENDEFKNTYFLNEYGIKIKEENIDKINNEYKSKYYIRGSKGRSMEVNTKYPLDNSSGLKEFNIVINGEKTDLLNPNVAINNKLINSFIEINIINSENEFLEARAERAKSLERIKEGIEGKYPINNRSIKEEMCL